FETEDFGDVDHTRDAEGRVDAEPSQFLTGAFELELEEVIHPATRHAEVIEGPLEAPLHRVGYDRVPRLRNRLQRVAVDLAVEGEHRRIEGLPRVVVLDDGLLCGLGRVQWTFCRIQGERRRTLSLLGYFGRWGRGRLGGS